MNRDKTQLYHAGLSQIESPEIAHYGFPIDSLPIRYLGMPLMHRKLKISECSPLIDKITGRFRTWVVKTLSYAGRVQLIASVILGIVAFWISTFVLPKGCIKQIEALCSRFLWSGNIEVKRAAKVAWATVCLPKKEGGLGLRRFAIWNRTLCLKLVCLLFSNTGSLWVAWHKHHHLRDVSFWALPDNSHGSGSWKSVLHLRPLAQKFLKLVVGNGENTSFWFDSWTPLGPLIKAVGRTSPRSFILPLNAPVAAACNDEGWILPPPRSEVALTLHMHLTTIILPSKSNSADHFAWVIDGFKCNGFSAKRTWNALRPNAPDQPWASAIWFKQVVPKHAFTMWIANMDRLPTRTRLASWGLLIQTSCCLCSQLEETRDHLLLTYDFSSQIWGQVLTRLSSPTTLFHNWNDLMDWSKDSSSHTPAILRKLVAQATIYHLWKQLNNVLHNHISIPTLSIFKSLDREIRNIISSRKHKNHCHNLMQL